MRTTVQVLRYYSPDAEAQLLALRLLLAASTKHPLDACAETGSAGFQGAGFPAVLPQNSNRNG